MQKGTAKSLEGNFKKRLDEYADFVPDESIRKKWVDTFERIDQVNSINIELLAISYVYIYLKYGDIFTQITAEISEIIFNDMTTNNFDMNILNQIINKTKEKNIESKKTDQYNLLDLLNLNNIKNDKINKLNNKFIISTAIYILIIARSLEI